MASSKKSFEWSVRREKDQINISLLTTPMVSYVKHANINSIVSY